MRRRYIAAWAVVIPVVVIGAMKYYFPLSYNSLMGYTVVVALVFKSALLSFWAVSKLKVLAFFKGLTFVQGLLLLVKRWFLDNVFARWLKRNILDHIMVGFKEFAGYYAALNFRSKVKNILLPLLIGGGLFVLLYLSGNLSHLLIFTELKVFVISISKTALLVITKIFGIVADSWLSPILEVFALSYFFSWLEDKLGKDNWLIRILNAIGERLNEVVFFFGDLNKRYIDPWLNDKVSSSSKQAAGALKGYVHNKKIEYEYEQFERLEKQILDGHIDAYCHFDGMERITDKQELYTLINERTKDRLCIVGYISRNSAGELVSEEVEDSYYHDIFILEGLASSSSYGVSRHQDIDPDHTDFWALNTSKYPATLMSSNNSTLETFLPPHSLTIIKTDKIPDFSGDIYAHYNGFAEPIVPITQEKKIE